MRKITLIMLIGLIFIFKSYSQENWTSSITGYDQTYSPADFVTASNGDIYLNGVKYDNGVSGFVNILYKSTNQGASWTEISTTGLTDLGNVHSLTFSGNTMLLAGMDVNSTNGAKIFKSTDNGSSWSLSMTGYDQTYSPADFVTASNGDIYLNGVKYDSGVSGFVNILYKSTNQGASWTVISTTGLTDLGNVHSLTFSGNTMLLAGMDVNSTNGAKIFKSTDNGSSWSLSITGYDQTYSPADFVTASNGDVYLNGVKYDSGISGFVNILYKSTNQGASWAEISTTGLTDLGNVHSLTISGNKMLLAGMHVTSTNGAKIFSSNLNTGTNILNTTANNNISCYPNPFDNELNVANLQDSKKIKNIKLISSTGKTIYSTKSNINIKINTADYESGMYFLILEYDNKCETVKLIKRN